MNRGVKLTAIGARHIRFKRRDGDDWEDGMAVINRDEKGENVVAIDVDLEVVMEFAEMVFMSNAALIIDLTKPN